MTVCYSLTRAEVVRAFFLSLSKSPRIFAIVFVASALPASLWLWTRQQLFGELRFADTILAVVWMAVFFFLFAFWIFLRAKTEERTLTISGFGIITRMGDLPGEVPWAKVKEVKDSGNYLIVVGTSGNAFFIPLRAFDGVAHRNLFLAEVNRLRESA
jgi:hypothetical protein